jgi:pimeloyl-ACP methyl ester carboxylesterase
MALRTFLDGALFAERLSGPDDDRPRGVARPGWGRDRHDHEAVVAGRDAGLFDLPGHGASPPPPTGRGSAEFAAEVAAAIDAIAPSRPVTLVCHSFGGRVGVHLAASRPDLVGGVVLCGVPQLVRVQPAYRPPLGYRIVRWANRRKLVPDSMMERLRQRRGSADYRATSGVMRDVFVQLVNESYEAQLRAITCPVAFLWGRGDTMAPLAVAEQARGLVADVVAFDVLDTGHDVHRTHPEAFAAVIAAVERPS